MTESKSDNQPLESRIETILDDLVGYEVMHSRYTDVHPAIHELYTVHDSTEAKTAILQLINEAKVKSYKEGYIEGVIEEITKKGEMR